MIRDLIAYIRGSLMDRIIRSGLTIMSIVLGIMAIYALLSFGQGLQKYIDEVAGDFGTDKLIAQPKGAGPPGSGTSFFNEDDTEFLEKQNGVKVVSPGYMSQLPVQQRLDEKGKWLWVMGMPLEQEKYDVWMFAYDVDSGRNLKKGDKYKVMLGYNHQIKDKIWNKPLEMGSKLYLNDIQFDVVGFVESVGNPSDDANVYIPLEVIDEVYDLDQEKYNFVMIQAHPDVKTKDLSDKLEDRLRRFRDVDEGQEDFFITTFEEQLEVFSSVINVLNAVLVLIAAVSVLVAAVNIANTMYTAVLERTKEIGVMKAIGATNIYIKSIFVAESAVLGFVGGLLGVLVGYGIATAAGSMAASAGYDFLKPFFPFWLTAGCLIFSTSVGTMSGYLPSRQAAKLKPVDALRYE